MELIDGMNQTTVAGVMTCNVVSVSPGNMLADTAAILAGENITEMPVVDEVGTCVGVLSASDVVGAEEILEKERVGSPVRASSIRGWSSRWARTSKSSLRSENASWPRPNSRSSVSCRPIWLASKRKTLSRVRFAAWSTAMFTGSSCSSPMGAFAAWSRRWRCNRRCCRASRRATCCTGLRARRTRADREPRLYAATNDELRRSTDTTRNARSRSATSPCGVRSSSTITSVPTERRRMRSAATYTVSSGLATSTLS